jgi:hypothetical protein
MKSSFFLLFLLVDARIRIQFRINKYLVEAYGVREAACPDGVQEAERPHPVHLSCVFCQVKRDLNNKSLLDFRSDSGPRCSY